MYPTCRKCGITMALQSMMDVHEAKCTGQSNKQGSGTTVTCRCGGKWYNVQREDFLDCNHCGRSFEVIWTDRGCGYQLYES